MVDPASGNQGACMRHSCRKSKIFEVERLEMLQESVTDKQKVPVIFVREKGFPLIQYKRPL
jgi:hypothetical protein